MKLPEKVTMIEVGPRDGLQNEKQFVPTDIKRQFIKKLLDAGFSEIEIASFVSPKWVPQMADAEQIVQSVQSDARLLTLAPNARGAETAISAGSKAVAVFIGVSSTFNQKNINRTTDEALDQLAPVMASLKNQGIFVRACVSTAFYCPFEGCIEEEATLDLCKRLLDLGADELSVADTIGKANPQESFSLFTKLKERFPVTMLTAHFHDTRKMALANIYAAMLAGIDRFDSSVGGLGGCPFAPGATGNVATEDVVYMLESMKIETGISLPMLKEAIDMVKPFVSTSFTSGYYTLSSTSG